MKFNPVASLRSFFANARHIMSVSSKPSPDEFTRTLKVVLLGAIVLGIFGFVISLIVGLIV
jgi:protein translocase SEC61 complex gamma subunit